MNNKITIQPFVKITTTQAGKIVKLLNNNKWNRPTKPYVKDELLKEPKGYFIALYEHNIIGVARLKKTYWYQWELFNIVIDKAFQKQGIASALINAVEQYVQENRGGLLQATIDPHNEASRKLFTKLGWKCTTEFIHPFYKKPIEVWNKSID